MFYQWRAGSLGSTAVWDDRGRELRPFTLDPIWVPRIERVRARWGGLARAAAFRHGVPIAWVLSIIHAESNGDPFAVSPVGAKGLMQLYDPPLLAAAGDPFDPARNVDVGTSYLARLRRQRRDLPSVASMYNCGGEAGGGPHVGGSWVGASGPWGLCHGGDYIDLVVRGANYLSARYFRASVGGAFLGLLAAFGVRRLRS